MDILLITFHLALKNKLGLNQYMKPWKGGMKVQKGPGPGQNYPQKQLNILGEWKN
jgi:hypothetical protein